MHQYKPGERIGGEYTVLNVFGGEKQSGMGVVYLIQNRVIPRPIVLKTTQRDLNDESKRQFLTEARAWVQAGSHNNIVQAHWVREIADQIFISAEYVAPDDEGRNTLTHFLIQGQLSTEIILYWATQFCLGMDYAQSKGVIVHRDIKPDNLMIDNAGTLKITDFGIAKSIEADAAKTKNPGWWLFKRKQVIEIASKTKTGSAMGTLPYMAPEQFINAKGVDHRADIYSFGIILYQMVTGNSYPYIINNNTQDIGNEFYHAHHEQKPAPAKSSLMPVISKCLEKKPERRYASYGDLITDLNAIAGKLSIKIPRAVHVAREDEELYSQAQSYVALGDKDRALKVIDEYITKYAENECGWTEKGRIHYERGEYVKAINATKMSLDLNPYNTHAWNNLGLLLDTIEAPINEIKSAFSNALMYDPYNTAAMMNFVGPLVDQLEYMEAASLTAKAIKLRPDKPNVLLQAKSLLKKLFDEGQLAASQELLSGWTTGRPSDADAWHNYGLLMLNNGDASQAIECFKKVRILSPLDNFAVAQLAKLYYQNKKGKECLDCCNILLQRGHEPILAIGLKARVINFLGRYDLSLEFIQPYLDQSPEVDALWVVLAEIHEYREKYSLAIRALNKAKSILESKHGAYNAEDMQYLIEKLDQLNSINYRQ